MPTPRFPGWGALEPVFTMLAAEPASQVAPALGPGWAEQRSTGERFLHLALDPECRPALRWFSRQLPDTSPQISGQCRLYMIEYLPSFILLTLFAGDVDESQPVVAEKHAALHVPVPLPRTSPSEGAIRWARGDFQQVMLEEKNGTRMMAPVGPPCRPRELKAALRHTQLVLDDNARGHHRATPIEEQLFSTSSGTVTPAKRTPVAPDPIDDLSQRYTQERRMGLVSAIELANTGRRRDVLRALADDLPAGDLAHIAFQGAEHPVDRLEALTEATTVSQALGAVMAHRSDAELPTQQADALVEQAVELLGPANCVDTWHATGMLDTSLCSLLARFDDRTAYHLALRHTASDTASHTERALADLGLDDLAHDVARRVADTAVLEAACTPQAGLPPGTVLQALRVGLQRSPASAADRMVELGWDPVQTATTIAAGRRWTTAWKWLSERARGAELIDLANRSGMTANDIIEVLGPKRRAAVKAMRQLGMTTPRIEQLLQELDLDDDHIRRLLGT